MEKRLSASGVEQVPDTEETRAPNQFSPDQVETFRQRINQVAGIQLFEESLSYDEVEGILELYGRVHSKPMQLDRLIARLHGKGVRALAREESVDHSNIIRGEANAIAIIARELDILFNKQESVGDFSPDQVETFRQRINEAIGEELLGGPLGLEEVMGLIDIYGRKNRSSATVGKQVARLTAHLKGKNFSEIAREEGSSRVSPSDMYSKAVEIIARELAELFANKVLNDIEASLIQCVHIGILSPEQSSVFKRHAGVVDEPLTNGQISRNTEACERLRIAAIDAKVRDRNRRDRKINNLPSLEEQHIFKRLLGSQPDAITPIARDQLIKQYEIRQRELAKHFAMDENELQQSIASYSAIVDKAILGTLQWIVKPQYIYHDARKD